jgi:hypothetical protein
MHKTRALILAALLAAMAIIAGSSGCNQGSKPAPGPVAEVQKPTVSPTGWQVPVDVFPPSPSPTPTPTQNDWLNLGWQTFVALDWPAVAGSNGQPNTGSTIGAAAANGALVPTVWQTYRDVSTIMLNNGVDPGASYTQAVSIPASCAAIGSNPVAPGFQPMFIDGSTFSQATIVKDYINQATGNPLVDQKGWYTLTDILLDQSEYTYIQQNGYFLGSKQAADYKKNGKLAPFPRTGQEFNTPLPSYAQYGALEVKAAWRVLDPTADKAIIPRYYTQWGYFMQPDGKTCQGPTLFGLIGLHILRLTPSTGGTWFWATFEQVDNTSAPAGMNATLAAANTPNGNCGTSYNKGPAQVTGNISWSATNPPNNLCEVTPIPTNVQQANQTWQKQLQGTVWQYYQMVNTLNPCSPGDTACATFYPLYDTSNQVNLSVYANTAIESYFQTHSCMDCHGSATGNGAPTKFTGTNQIFTFALLNAYYPQSAAARQRFLKLFRTPPHSKLVVAPKPKTEKDKYEKK